MVANPIHVKRELGGLLTLITLGGAVLLATGQAGRSVVCVFNLD